MSKLFIKPNISNKKDCNIACSFAREHSVIFVLILNEREVISKQYLTCYF